MHDIQVGILLRSEDPAFTKELLVAGILIDASASPVTLDIIVVIGSYRLFIGSNEIASIKVLTIPEFSGQLDRPSRHGGRLKLVPRVPRYLGNISLGF